MTKNGGMVDLVQGPVSSDRKFLLRKFGDKLQDCILLYVPTLMTIIDHNGYSPSLDQAVTEFINGLNRCFRLGNNRLVC